MKEEQKEQQNEQQNEQPEKKGGIVREIVEIVLYAFGIVVLVWCMNTFVGQRTEVNGMSMYSTLEDGDDLWLDKLSYKFTEPERFDIVVFPHREGDLEEYYIKRIIGLPGEKVRIDAEDGTIYINDEPLEEDYGYEQIDPSMVGRADEDILLGEDEYFVMGDNRNNSSDSRIEEVGNIKRDDLVGKVAFRMLPFSKFGKVE